MYAGDTRYCIQSMTLNVALSFDTILYFVKKYFIKPLAQLVFVRGEEGAGDMTLAHHAYSLYSLCFILVSLFLCFHLGVFVLVVLRDLFDVFSA